MGRTIVTTPCIVCGLDYSRTKKQQRMHKECVGSYQSGIMLGTFEPMRMPYTPPSPTPLPQFHYDTPNAAARASATTPPPNTEPIGRPFDDPRNSLSLNRARQTGSHPFLSPLRIGVFDIETTALNAGFGVVLCAVVKLYSPDELYVLRADNYDAWKAGRRSDDRALVSDILAVLEMADVLVAHNGVRFDSNFLRTRAVIHNLPPVNWQKIIDPMMLARQHFRFPGNSLDSISRVLGTPSEKTPLVPETWQRATMDGDAAALEDIVVHCVEDVEVLEQICSRLRGYVKQIDRTGSFR